MVQIERDLDELTYSGAAINDLEMQLTRTKQLYQQVLVDGRSQVEMLRRKLQSHIVKSEPFIDIWRRARQVQDMSNKAAARYDKANSQHTASKEMIRVAESQLDAFRKEQEEQEACSEPSSPSPLDLAWQEMLNHATTKVVVTEKERRDSELEHRRILEECKRVMDEYRTTERKLRSHIVKSRPYFQERYRVNQQLAKLKGAMKNLEQKINESKQSYSASLRRLEVLNTEMHERRGTISKNHGLDPRQVASTGTSPLMRRRRETDDDDTASLSSLQLSGMAADYCGSTGSLPSIGVLSNSEISQVSDSLENLQSKMASIPLHEEKNSPMNTSDSYEQHPNDMPPPSQHLVVPPRITHVDASFSEEQHDPVSPRASDMGTESVQSEEMNRVASDLVVQCLANAVHQLSQESRHLRTS